MPIPCPALELAAHFFKHQKPVHHRDEQMFLCESQTKIRNLYIIQKSDVALVSQRKLTNKKSNH
jgi:hypothetical protein